MKRSDRERTAKDYVRSEDQEGQHRPAVRPTSSRHQSMGPGYDPSVIADFAQRLYDRAETAVGLYTIGGAVIGLALGGALGIVWGINTIGAALIGTAVLGYLGYMAGSGRAFRLKLEAQTALCQVEIERNTREAKDALRSPST